MNVMGMRRSGIFLTNFQFLCLISLLIDEEILAQVKNVSADSKNNTLEFNEFIKMVALDMKTDATKNRDELFEAFRWIWDDKCESVENYEPIQGV